MTPFAIGITDHVEGPSDRPSLAVFAEVAELVELADSLGVAHAWFAEHHAHAHHGHLPTPLLFALHLAGRTRSIRLGTAISCLNLHHPLDLAEQVLVADALAGGRIAVGFGSGSTPAEVDLFGAPAGDEGARHARFEAALDAIGAAWRDPAILPRGGADLVARSWIAVNSEGSARIAGRFGANVLFSHLRTPEQYRSYALAYRRAGGPGRIAANRPVHVGVDDEAALARAEPALRILWRRFRAEGKIPADTPEPADPRDLCGHPINFVVGGPGAVARGLLDLNRRSPFDVANLEVRWAGLDHADVLDSLRRLMLDVVPLLGGAGGPSFA